MNAYDKGYYDGLNDQYDNTYEKKSAEWFDYEDGYKDAYDEIIENGDCD